MKITVLGDIMCEPPILKASKKADGTYDFHGVFEKVRPMLSEADYVIANLEFPLAGEAAGYSDEFYCFNAPDSFADAVKAAGVDLVSTVNNHTLDRGAEGMFRTLRVLDAKGIPHTGNFLPEEGHKEAYYFELQGVKFAVVAYTYTTNEFLPDGDENLAYINYLRYPRMSAYTPEIRKKMKTWVDKCFKGLKEEKRAVIKKCVGLPNTVVRPDDNMEMDKIKPFMEQFVSDIRTAKEKADVVICYPHVGGQFNPKPGKFSEYVVEEAVKAGADMVLASHSHMVQKACYKGKVPCVYSLGNFSMSPNSTIIVNKNLPEYGLAIHLYMDGKKLEKVTFSILKGVEKKGTQLVSWPVDELYRTLKTEKEKALLKRHVCQVYEYVTGKIPVGEVIRREYELEK